MTAGRVMCSPLKGWHNIVGGWGASSMRATPPEERSWRRRHHVRGSGTRGSTTHGPATSPLDTRSVPYSHYASVK